MSESLERSDLGNQIRGCYRCPMRSKVRQPLPGVGPRSAQVVVLARSPSKYDDQEGKPLSGKFGEMLGECLAILGLRKRDVGFIHTVSCFTTDPDNRDPTYEEICNCADWRERQLNWFDEKRVVLAWGRPAINAVFGGYDRMTDVVGQLHRPSLCEGRENVDRWGVIPFWHPVYLMKDRDKKIEFRTVLAPVVKQVLGHVLESGVPWYTPEIQGDLFSSY